MKKLICLLLIIYLSFASVFADDGRGVENPILGGFQLYDTEDIEMTDEVVEIWEDHVCVKFHFTNLTHEAKKVQIGFPVYWGGEYGVGAHDEVVLKDDEQTRNMIDDYYKFKSTCNGKILERKLVASVHGDMYDYYYVATLQFEPDEVLEVIDSYNAGNKKGSDSCGYGYTSWEYILTTGSTWANVIKSAEIIFHSKHDWSKYQKEYVWNINDMSYYSCGFSYKPDEARFDNVKDEWVIKWNLRNIKPKENWKADINTSYRLPLSDRLYQYYAVFLLEEQLALIPEYYEMLKEKEYYANNMSLDVWKMSKNDFYDCIKDLYTSGFDIDTEKNEVTKIYAQFIINSIYAIHGYDFKDEKWKTVFNHFDWYKGSVKKLSNKDFTAEELEMIEELKLFR